MEFFDLRSGYLVVGALYFFVPIATWVALQRERGLSALLWCVGGSLVGVGTVLTSFRGHVPGWMAFSVANTILICSMLMRVAALNLLRDRPVRKRWYLVLLSLLVVFSESVGYPSNDGYSFPFVMFVHTVLTAYIGHVAYRVGREQQVSSAYWITGNYLCVAALLLVQIYQVSWAGISPDILRGGVNGIVLVLVGAVTSVTNYMGYVGLVLYRVKKRELEAVAHATRQEESLRLSTLIAQLQRQQMVGEMSAYFAHEVRQPLTALISTAQLARRGLSTARMDSREVTTLIERVIGSARRVEAIVGRVLSHVRPGVLERTELDLSKLLEEADDLMQAEARVRQVILIPHLQVCGVRVMGDAVQIVQILNNLIRNAIEAACVNEHPFVTITVSTGKDEVTIEVADNGKGFSEEALRRAGEPFFTTKPDGLGVGLSISREMARLLGGHLSWCNGSVGARAILRLPLAVSPA